MQFYQQIQEILTNNVFQDYGVIGLFLNSFLSSTAIPLPTEILTSALLLGGESQILVSIARSRSPVLINLNHRRRIFLQS